ncbi:MAG TPA: S49 family peptidase [Candidatus Paceibacterota bacterium]|nr:S49 family peptidase [Candidatus Paceibacterota bacterium]
MSPTAVRAAAVIAALAVLAIFLYFLAPTVNACNVAYIPLHGDLKTYIPATDLSTSTAQDETASEDTTMAIRQAAADPSIEAIVLEIDSPGGDPVAGQEIESTLKSVTKPTVALIRSMGDSAAYMAATGANTIFANQFSDVGDIGITESYTDQARQDVASGVTYNQLSIGKYKDMFATDKPLTPDEKALAISQLQVYYQDFVNIVAQNRNMSTSTVLALADGASMPAQQALQDGLIDKLGTIDDVRSFLAQKLSNPAIICGIDTN